MLYVAFAIAQARFDIRSIAVNLAWPFLFFYFVACLLKRVSTSSEPVIQQRDAWVVIAVLVGVDHLFKFAFSHMIPLGGSVPVVANHLHLANVHNVHGSFWLAKLSASRLVAPVLVISVLSVALAPLLLRFYSARHRKSFWSVLAYCCFMAGAASAAIDLGARGFTVDYLELPGLFVADLKDIYLNLFVSAFFVEVLSNPRISMRWLGWRAELREFPCLATEIVKFAVGEIRRLGRNV
jgi:lipoprotein signal peptidase